MSGEKKEPKGENVSSSASSHKGGSIIIDKTHEPLDAALRAYEGRLTSLVELPKKLKKYPNAREEKVRLVVQQQQIRDTQTLIEGPPPSFA